MVIGKYKYVYTIPLVLMQLMKNVLYLLIGLSAILSSCSQYDQLTGVWNKNVNAEFDGAAFPQWQSRGRTMTDSGVVESPLFIRIKKSGSQYVMSCYIFDGSINKIVKEASVFDYVIFTKAEENVLISDNAASGMATNKLMIVRLDKQTGLLSMSLDVEKESLPESKRGRALLKTMFNSGFHKLIDIRRKTDDPALIDQKLKEEHIILNP